MGTLTGYHSSIHSKSTNCKSCVIMMVADDDHITTFLLSRASHSTAKKNYSKLALKQSKKKNSSRANNRDWMMRNKHNL